MEGKTIFIADDDEFASNSISILVKGQKGNPQVFTNGVSLVKAYKENSAVFFILMDLSMPGMDGYQAAKEIRAHEKSKGIAAVKIYGLSGDSDAKTIAACKDAGMNDLLAKPLKKDKLSSLF